MPIPFASPQPVEHSVDGQILKFYPISTRMLFQLRSLAKPIARAIGTLLQSKQNDYGKETVEVKSPEDAYQIRTSVQAISADLAKTRHDQMAAALDSLIDGLVSESTAMSLALLIMDSLREEYPQRPATPQMAQQFLADTPAPAMIELLMGVAAANRKLFDPLKARVADITATLKNQLDGLRTEPSEETPTTSSGSTSSKPQP